MKAALKALLMRSLPPGLRLQATAALARRHSQWIERHWRLTDLTSTVAAHEGDAVTAGPFAGMRMPPRALARHLAPKLFGAYECELNEVVSQVVARSYSEVLVVGAAEGYYAVGFARAMPGVTVHAFDTDPWARATTRDTARLNGAENVVVRGACTPEWLARNLKPRSFLLSDCEGYEDVLLVPHAVPALRACDILVEIHDRQAPGVGARIVERFASSHDVESIDARPRSPADYPRTEFLPEADRARALEEYRSDGFSWLWLRAREAADTQQTG